VLAIRNDCINFKKAYFLRSGIKQVKIIVASMTLHNFIKKHVINDAKFHTYDDEEDLLPTKRIGDHYTKD
jgi:hypothetical protein